MGVKLLAASSGSVELVPANTASNYSVTVPAATTTMVGTDTTQTLTNKTLSSPTMTTPVIDSATFATVSGTAPLYGCRAWANFDGTRNVTNTGASTNGQPVYLRASGNVTSVTKNATGDFTVTFTTAMSDTNYAIAGTGGNSGGALQANVYPYTLSTASVRVITMNASSSLVDRDSVFVTVFR